MKESPVGSCSDLIDDSRLKVQEECPGDKFPSSSFCKESSHGIVSSLLRFLSIRLYSMLKAEEFPAGVADLNTSLSDMQIDHFSHMFVVV